MPSEHTRIGNIIRTNPFFDHPIDVYELDLLVNRQKEVERLQEALVAASSGFRQNFAILGDDGSGKTSILNILEARANLIPKILIVRQEITASTTELVFFKGIVGTIIRELEKLGGRPFSGDVQDIKKRVEGIVEEKSTVAEVSLSIGALLSFLGIGGKFGATEKVVKGRYEDVAEILPSLETVVRVVLAKKFTTVVVALDEAGYAVAQTTKSLLQRLRLLFQKPHFMLAVSGNPLLIDDLAAIEPSFANLIPATSRISLAKLEQGDVRRLIETRLAKVRIRGKGLDPFTAESADEVWRQSKGNPRDIILICHETLNLASSKDSVGPDDVIKASRIVLSLKGRDAFAKLREHEKEIAYMLHSVGEDYLRGLAKRLKKKPSTVSVQVNRMLSLGYVEVSATRGRRVYHRLSRPLEEYLGSLSH